MAEPIHTDAMDESPFNLLTAEKSPFDLSFKCAMFALINVIICAVAGFAWSFTEFSTHWFCGRTALPEEVKSERWFDQGCRWHNQ